MLNRPCENHECASFKKAPSCKKHGYNKNRENPNEYSGKRNQQKGSNFTNSKKHKIIEPECGSSISTIEKKLKTTKISLSQNISKYNDPIPNSVERDEDSDGEVTNEKSRACKAFVKPIPQLKPYYNLKQQYKGKHSGNVNNVQSATSQQPEKINPEEIKIAVEKSECYKNAEAYKSTCIRINCSPSSAIVPSLNHVPTDVLEIICNYLDNHNQLNIIAASNRLAEAFTNSSTNLKKFKVEVNRHNISSIIANTNLHIVQLRNLSIDFEGINNIKGPFIVKNLFKDSIENLELHNAKFRSIDELSSFINDLSNLKSLTLNKCNLDQHFNKNLPGKSTLKTIYFNKCNDNIFKAFSSQHFIEKITIRNDDWTWNGFPHEIVNDMMFNCKNIKHLVHIGAGTGSFFDSDNFSFIPEKLDTTMITFHWYVGIKNGRVSFLKTQLGNLKELTIHKLSFDFDGEEIKDSINSLQKFYYGKIPLILNGKKQDVKEFEANEIQIQSTFEMFRQFPCIKSLRLTLSATDIASDEVEKVVNPPTDLFKNLEEFKVVDNSRYRGTLGVYLGLFKNLKNIKNQTQDRNIIGLLDECLTTMSSGKALPKGSRIPIMKMSRRRKQSEIFYYTPPQNHLKLILLSKIYPFVLCNELILNEIQHMIEHGPSYIRFQYVRLENGYIIFYCLNIESRNWVYGIPMRLSLNNIPLKVFPYESVPKHINASFEFDHYINEIQLVTNVSNDMNLNLSLWIYNGCESVANRFKVFFSIPPQDARIIFNNHYQMIFKNQQVLVIFERNPFYQVFESIGSRNRLFDMSSGAYLGFF